MKAMKTISILNNKKCALAALMGLSGFSMADPGGSYNPPRQAPGYFEDINYHFSQEGDANWTSEEGVTYVDQGNGFLVTHALENFHLSFEVYAEKGTNSGVFFRCANALPINDRNCLEANIFDTRADQTYRTGALTGFSRAKAKVDTEGRWNTYQVDAVGDWVKVTVNGEETARLKNGEFNRRGRLAFQFAGGGLKLRNMRLTEFSNRNRGYPSTRYFLSLTKLLESKPNSLEGQWTMTRFETQAAGERPQPWCVGAEGTISYRNHHMYVAINCPSDSQKQVHYSGRYLLEDGGMTVVHQVENASNPDWIGQEFRRTVSQENPDQLDLVGPFGTNGRAIVSWERVLD